MSQNNKAILAYLEQNELDKALYECLKLVESNPTDADAQHLLGLIYAKMHNFQDSIKHFAQAIQLDPQQSLYHNNISNAYKRSGNLEAAIRHLNEALILDPNNAESYNNLGGINYTLGNIKLAIPQFEKAIRLNPNIWEAHYNLANCLVKQDMLQQAITHYQTVLKLNPNHANAKLNLTMTLIGVNDYASALPALEEIAASNPEHIELQGHLADAYLTLGQTDNALNQYIKATTLDPNRPEWQHNLAVLYLRTRQYELAKQHFAITLKLNPKNQTAIYMLDALNGNVDIKAAPEEYIQKLFDQYAHYYTQHMTKVLNYNVPQLLRQAISATITNATKQKRILDLGCGTGLCGIYFRDLANFLVGVDLSSEMLAEAKKLGAYDALCCCNILQTIPGLNLEYFDLILAADVFIYIGDLEQLFTMLQSTLVKGGHIAFSIEEQADGSDFILQTSGRYAHSVEYIRRISNNYGFKIFSDTAITPRTSEHIPVNGRLFVLEKY